MNADVRIPAEAGRDAVRLGLLRADDHTVEVFADILAGPDPDPVSF